MTRRIGAWVLFLWCLAGIRGAWAATTIDLIFVDPPDSSFQVAARQFKKVVEAKSGGRLRVAIHANGSWQGRSLDELGIVRALAQGTPQVAIVSASPLSGYNAEMQALDAPFLFRDYRQVDHVLDGSIGKRLLDGLTRHGLYGLSFLDCGFRIFSSSKPIQRLSDFQNKSVRVMQSRTYINLVKAFQAKPVPSAVDKIHAMAAKGYIDAADRSYPTYWDFKLYEVQKFITETNHAYAAKVLVANGRFFSGLPPELQQAVRQAALAARAPQRKAFRADVARVKREVARRGVRIFTLNAADRQAFVNASRPVMQQVSRLVGADLVRQIQGTR